MNKKANECTSKSSNYLQEKLESVLQKINEEGEFKASIISTLEGFTLASKFSEFDDVVISAISVIVQDVSAKAQRFIGFNRMDEVSLVDDDKFRLVCREFEAIGRKFVLTVVVPPYKTYRRLTNIALRDIEKILNEREETRHTN